MPAAVPSFTVIIPAYNGAAHLGAAIRSVLAQSCADLELVVVDDASPDDVADVVGRFKDPRVRLLKHDVNRGANAARNTGIRASTGRLISFLDQDDLLHPNRLEADLEFRARQSDAGVTYGPRYEMNYNSASIRDLWMPPDPVSLADLVLGFPLSPTDIVVSRAWVNRVGTWIEDYDVHGGEITFLGRLYMEGCRFEHVVSAPTYRRHQSGRIHRDIEGHCKAELAAQRTILDDPKCPAEVAALRDVAFSNTWFVWGCEAFLQGEKSLGQSCLRKALRLNQTLLDGEPSRLVRSILDRCAADDGEDHAALFACIVSQLPEEIKWVGRHRSWAAGQGLFLKGLRATVWDRSEEGRSRLENARARGVRPDPEIEQRGVHQILSREQVEGHEKGQRSLVSAVSQLRSAGYGGSARRLYAACSMGRGLRRHLLHDGAGVRRNLARALCGDPRYALNRGVWSMLLRSLGRPARAGEN
jgi:hypothetical protein